VFLDRMATAMDRELAQDALTGKRMVNRGTYHDIDGAISEG